MKIKKLLAAIAAFAFMLPASAVNISAADEYTARLGFSDLSWAFQDWESSAAVTGNGQYTIETDKIAGSPDFGVFVIDIEDMYAECPDVSVVLDKIEIDGKEISFDTSKILYGNIEENGDFRIDIYNQYSDTMLDPGVKQATPVNTDLKVTFTVSGIEEENTETADMSAGSLPAAPEADGAEQTSFPDSGNIPIAFMISAAVFSGAALLASIKRK